MHPGLLVFGGFLLGTVGVKAVRSKPAHRAYVRATAYGLQCKDYVAEVIDEAKADCDDIMAEAKLLNEIEAAEKAAEEVIVDETVVVVDDEPAKAAPKRTSKRTTAKKSTGTTRKRSTSK